MSYEVPAVMARIKCPKAVLWFNCVLRDKFHLPLLNGGGGGGAGGILINWNSPLYNNIIFVCL